MEGISRPTAAVQASYLTSLEDKLVAINSAFSNPSHKTLKCLIRLRPTKYPPCGGILCERRRKDSNLRSFLQDASLAVRCFRPLSHVSSMFILLRTPTICTSANAVRCLIFFWTTQSRFQYILLYYELLRLRFCQRSEVSDILFDHQITSSVKTL